MSPILLLLLLLFGQAPQGESPKQDPKPVAAQTTPPPAAEPATDPERMIEVDVIIVVVRDFARQSVGFDFLSLVSLNYDFFLTDLKRSGSGFLTPNTVGAVTGATQAGHLFSASVDYDVNIANARDEQVSVLARPHLTTLNGKPAEFLSGGELVFQVSGIESGDIKPYPFDIQLHVKPTLMQPSPKDGIERVLLEVEAIRTSILGLAFPQDAVGGSDDVNFDKTRVKSTALLALDEVNPAHRHAGEVLRDVRGVVGAVRRVEQV